MTKLSLSVKKRWYAVKQEKKTDENVAVVSFFSRFFTAMRPFFTLQLSCAKALSFYPTSYHCVFA